MYEIDPILFNLCFLYFSSKIQTICHEYVRALQWIAHYYFNGLQSWSWYECVFLCLFTFESVSKTCFESFHRPYYFV